MGRGSSFVREGCAWCRPQLARFRNGVAAVAALSIALLFSVQAAAGDESGMPSADFAQTQPCTKDTECNGDHVCEAGACVAPTTTPRAASAQPAPVVAPPRTKLRSMPVVVLGAAAGTAGLILIFRGFSLRLGESMCNGLGRGIPGDPQEDDETIRSRCSQGAGTMMLTGLGLTLVSIPLVAIGAKRVPDVPAARVALVPLGVPKGVGVGVRLEL